MVKNPYSADNHLPLRRAGTVQAAPDYAPAAQETTPNEDSAQGENGLPPSGKVNQETYQQTLADLMGYYVICELLIGVERLVLRQGFLIDVGESFFTLYDTDTLSYTICDLYSVKFITYFNDGRRPTTEQFETWLDSVRAANLQTYQTQSNVVI